MLEMQAGRRFIHNIECMPGSNFRRLSGKFNTPCFSATQRSAGLAQGKVTQAHRVECTQYSLDGTHTVKKFYCFRYRHLEHNRDIFPLIVNFKSLPVVPLSITCFAVHIDVGMELHFNFAQTVPVAGFPPASCYIECAASMS